MKPYFTLVLLLFTSGSILAQKGKSESEIPRVRQDYKRFSVFAYQDNRYIHQETNDVWMETYLNLNPKSQRVILPGLGESQICNYKESECDVIENDDGIELIVIPLECTSSTGTEENRILRIHTVRTGGRTDYVFSLAYVDTKDLVLFHNYSDQEIGQLLSKDMIRFDK